MRSTMTFRTIVSLLCLAWSAGCWADVYIIVNRENPLQSMTQREVSDLYLGRVRSFGESMKETSWSASIYEQPEDSHLREIFFRCLNGMSIKQLNAYWARLRFSGEVLPPKALPDSKAVVEAVKRDRNAIGYVHSSEAPDSVKNDAVKIVLRLKE